MVYDPVIDGRLYVFGVSGRLYQRNLLLYDRETESLWSQLLSVAVTGPLAGRQLATLPCVNTTWAAWQASYPQTSVMSFDTGYSFDYHYDLYATYPISRQPALLVRTPDGAKIYPFAELEKGPEVLINQVKHHKVVVEWNADSKNAMAYTLDGTKLWTAVGFTDVLETFHPEAEVYQFR